MHKFYHLLLGVCLLLFAAIYQPLKANDPAYEQRRTTYINNCLAHFDGDAITIQAYMGLPVDTPTIDTLAAHIAAEETSDFDIVKLIRVLYYTHGEYDARILPAINSVPYWLTKNETKRVYWSENHLIMWMGSDWLLHEKYGKAIDSGLDYRLRHYLHLKIQYGFYEFFSSVYAPYCLSGLLNLADFAQDAEIKDLATQAAQRLLTEMLMLTTEQGVFFPAAGRNYYGKYDGAFGQNHSNLIYLLTGFDPLPGNASHAGGFLASSSIPVDTIINSWRAHIDTVYHVGHTLDSGFVINQNLQQTERIIFQWSSGAYFHPEVTLQSAQLIIDSNLWGHQDFAPFAQFQGLSPQGLLQLATTASCISESSVICGEDISIFKNKSVSLSSIKDFWKGKVGFQEFPVVAAVGTTAVFPASGKIIANWGNRNSNNANNDLPYVGQKKNLALIMYRPETKLQYLGYKNPEVSLHWNAADFDEIAQDSLWLLGRQGNNYVAVRRGCIDTVNGLWACLTPQGQAWAIMVGDSTMYGDFSNFKSLIHQSQLDEQWYYDSVNHQNVYYAKVVVDTTTIDYAWGVDSITTGIADISANNPLHIYPNPAKDEVNIDVTGFDNQTVAIKVYNLLGEEVYAEPMSEARTGTLKIKTQNWANGIYMVALQSGATITTQKFVIER